MGLKSVITAMEGELTHIKDSRVPADVKFKFGPATLTNEDAPPRIVWIPGKSPIDGPEKSAGEDNPVQILTRRQLVEAHCWGGTFDQAEAMGDAVWYALHKVAPGVYTPQESDPGVPDNLQRGWIFTLTFEVLLPVTKPEDPTVQPETVTITGGFT